MLDPRRLQTFRAVLATGSVSAAAKALGYTPSSVSQQMGQLQRDVGVALFEPDGRGIRPTPAARLLDDRAEVVLRALHGAEQAMADHRAGRVSRLRVEYFATAGRAVAAPASAAFTEAHPEVQLELRLDRAGDPVARVLAGEVDLAFHTAGPVLEGRRDDSGRTPAAPSGVPSEGEGLTWVPLLVDPFVAVLPEGHALAGRERVGLRDLAAEPWVSHEWPLGCCSRELVDACAAQGFEPVFGVEADEMALAQRLVASGLGVGVMPSVGLTRPEAGVVTVPLEEPAPCRRIYLVHAAGHELAEAWAAEARRITGGLGAGAG